MSFLWLGFFSFAPLYLYDRLKLRSINRSWLFLVGCAGIFVGSAGCFFTGSVRFSLPVVLKALSGLAAAINAFLMVWALFFALPKGTYDGESSSTADTGLYALCRHPGVLFFGGMHFFLWLVSGRDMMLFSTVLFTLCNVFYVFVQDRKYFPLMLPGYEEYRERVPFLIPTVGSVSRCFKTFDEKR